MKDIAPKERATYGIATFIVYDYLPCSAYANCVSLAEDVCHVNWLSQ